MGQPHNERTTKTKEENYALKKQVKRRDGKITKIEKDSEEKLAMLKEQINIFRSALAEKHAIELEYAKKTDELLEKIRTLEPKASFWDREQEKKGMKKLKKTTNLGCKKKNLEIKLLHAYQGQLSS